MMSISSFTDSFFGVVQVKKVKKKWKSNKSKKPRLRVYSEKSGLFFRWLNENKKRKATKSYKRLKKAGKSVALCGQM
jgi:hypothetical protein